MTYDVKEALELFEETKNGWHDIYEAAKNDLDFYMGNQWEDKDKNVRQSTNRPALVINRLPQFVHQVTNDVRMNTPTINVLPVDSGADIETAKTYKGLIKHIEYASNADEAYDTAVEYAVKSSIGFLRVDHQYATPDGFEQELLIKRVVNPLSVYLDVSSIECDGRDAMHAYQLDTMSEKAFKKLYPGSNPKSFGDNSLNKTTPDKDGVTIAEFFRIEEEEKQAALLEDGSIMEYADGLDGVRTVRKFKKRRILRCKMSAEDVLEETTFPGIYIPIVPVYGEEHWADGKRHIFSLIRQAKDAQRRYNHWASKETEILSQAPIAPIMAAQGQTEDWHEDWRNPERAVVLRYKTTDATGQQIPPPQRLAPPQVPAGIVNAMQGAVEDMKATMGLYDASIGRRSNETSGIAIESRKKEGDVATFHFGDNLVRSITQVGRILVGAIPEVYDTKRVIRIVDDEENPKMVGINGEIVKDQKQHFKLSDGQYDVRVSTGASFTTQRQEAAFALQQLFQADSQLIPVAGDLLAKNMDFPGAQALAARLKKLVPSQLLSPEEQQQREQESQQQADPEKQQMQQIIQQGAQELQNLQQQVAQLEQQATIKDAGANMDKAQSELKAQSNSLKDQELIASLKLANQEKDLEIAKLQAQQEISQQLNESQPQQLPEQPKTPPISIVMSRDGLAEHYGAVDAQEQQRKADDDAKELAMKQAEIQAQSQMAQAIVDAVNNLTMAVTTPKQVVRDDSGRVVGVQ